MTEQIQFGGSMNGLFDGFQKDAKELIMWLLIFFRSENKKCLWQIRWDSDTTEKSDLHKQKGKLINI